MIRSMLMVRLAEAVRIWKTPIATKSKPRVSEMNGLPKLLLGRGVVSFIRLELPFGLWRNVHKIFEGCRLPSPA